MFRTRSDPVTTRFRTESVPANAANERELEEKLADFKKWTVFPSTEAGHADFTPIYEIAGITAEANGDERLAKAASTMKMYIEGTEISVWIMRNETAKGFRRNAR